MVSLEYFFTFYQFNTNLLSYQILHVIYIIFLHDAYDIYEIIIQKRFTNMFEIMLTLLKIFMPRL